MKIRFRSSGGVGFFPGLNAPTEIDTATLPTEDRAQLEASVAGASFFERPDCPAASPAARDHRTYEITVNEGARARTLTVADPISEDLEPLVQHLRRLARDKQTS
jgi:hypothetical protein